MVSQSIKMVLKKEDINQEVFNLYDEYAHNKIDRRQFAEKLSLYAIGGLTVTSLMSFMMPDYQEKIQVQAQSPAQDQPRQKAQEPISAQPVMKK